jgi:DNA-binding NarL/FixJ family response regulator
MPDLRVLVVSPNAFARAGLASLLEGMPGVTVVGTSAVSEAASLAGQVLPDVALVDAGAGELEDLDQVARLSVAQPGLPIVALAEDLGGLAQALSFGAAALLSSGTDARTLAAALLAAVNGLVSVPRSEILALLPVEEPIEAAVRAPVESLTAREIEVLQLMARGLTNRQIAGRLHISEHTVKFHAAAILGKVNARSRAEAVARAIGLGWILV